MLKPQYNIKQGDNTRRASGESAKGGQIDQRVLYRLLIYIMLCREGKYLKIINCLKVVIYAVMFYTYECQIGLYRETLPKIIEIFKCVAA
jgi:hypothetical protein